MGARLRVITAILLGIAGLLIVVYGAYLLMMRDARVSYEEARTWSRVHLMLFRASHNRYPLQIASGVLVVGLAMTGVALALWRRRARWPLLVVAAGAVAGIAIANWLRGDIEQSEPPGYREHSPYVHAARVLATGVTVYLVVLGVLALAAWWLSRPREVAPAAAPSA